LPLTLQGGNGNIIGGLLGGLGQGNVISGNGKAGVSLGAGAANHAVFGNLIGTDASGMLALGNTFAGITLSGASGNMIGTTLGTGRNVLAGNLQDGIFLTNAVGNTVAANYIGTDITGAKALPNQFNGISLNKANANTIGVPSIQAGNVLSGNAYYGVELFGGSTGNSLQDNYIGVTANGGGALGNGSAGILVADAPANTIGGSAAATGNVISANGDAGIYIVGPGAAGNLLQGNKLGTDLTGNSARGNALEGIYIETSPSNTIGGPLPGAGNLISGNGTRGIFLTNAGWSVIQGNLIGTKADALSALPNTFHNLECEAGVTNTTIGGPGAAANVIAFAPSGFAGVRIRNGSFNNRILGNAIFSNGALGIDLGPAGVTPNDPCDTDSGANLLQNFPVLTQAVSGGATGTRGTLNSAPNTAFLLQFFANPVCNSSGYGEGRIYLGDANAMTDGTCNASFLARLPVPVPPGYAITATATDPAGNTSEFSACQSAAPVPLLAITPGSNHQASFSWTNTAAGFVLKQAASLAPPVQWATVTNLPVTTNGHFTVTLPIGATNEFFRLSFE
jgi:hypothetical protein